MTSPAQRALVASGALSGALGTGLSAVAAHLTGPGSLDVAARFLLVHAPVFLAVAALLATSVVGRRTALAASLAIAVGLALFAGDLSVRALAGVAPVPSAAPTGGVVLIVGWLLLGVSGIVARGR